MLTRRHSDSRPYSPVGLAAFLMVSLLGAGVTSGQVLVDVRLEKTSYIVGEPIFVIADVTNNYAEPIAYRERLDPDTNLALTVAGVERRHPLADMVTPCSQNNTLYLLDNVRLVGLSYIAAGASRTFRFLLSDYELMPGRYQLRGNGRVSLWWKFNQPLTPSAPPTPMARAFDGQPVSGSAIDQTFSFVVTAGTDDALKQTFAPYLEAATAARPVARTAEARHAIITLAPPILEETISWWAFDFVAREDTRSYASVEAVARVGTRSARLALKDLLQVARSQSLQTAIVRAFSATATSDDAQYLTTLLNDETRPESVRGAAALGLGRIGTPDTIRALADWLPMLVRPGAAPELAKSVIGGLGLSKSPLAVKALIDAAPSATREQLRIGSGVYPASGDDICEALTNLTHHRWCDGNRTRTVEAVSGRWSKWWADHGTTVPLFGNDACLLEERMPVLPE